MLIGISNVSELLQEQSNMTQHRATVACVQIRILVMVTAHLPLADMKRGHPWRIRTNQDCRADEQCCSTLSGTNS